MTGIRQIHSLALRGYLDPLVHASGFHFQAYYWCDFETRQRLDIIQANRFRIPSIMWPLFILSPFDAEKLDPVGDRQQKRARQICMVRICKLRAMGDGGGEILVQLSGRLKNPKNGPEDSENPQNEAVQSRQFFYDFALPWFSPTHDADVAELADALDSGSSALTGVEVQVLSSALRFLPSQTGLKQFFAWGLFSCLKQEW